MKNYLLCLIKKNSLNSSFIILRFKVINEIRFFINITVPDSPIFKLKKKKKFIMTTAYIVTYLSD